MEQAGKTNPYIVLLLEQTLWPLQGFCNVFIYLRPRVASVRKLHPDISYSLALYISLFEYDSIERARIIHKYSTQRIMASSRALSSQKCSVERYSSQKLSIGKRSNLSSEHHNPHELEGNPIQDIAEGEIISHFDDNEQSQVNLVAIEDLGEAANNQVPA